MNQGFTVPKFRLPGFVAAVGAKLPQWPHALALVAGLNLAVKMRLLPEDSLNALEDRLFRVRVYRYRRRSGLHLSRRPLPPGLPAGREPDLAFAANLSAFLQLLNRQEDPDTLFFNRELEITGDTELGLVVKNMLDAVEWPSLPRLPLARR